MRNSVVKKIMFYIDVRFVSPVSVSSGNGDATDGDVLRDYEGKPFIAGSSLAGAMRSYLNFDKNEKCIFGYGQNRGDDQGKMSSLFMSDLEFTEKARIIVRDGVGLTEHKTSDTNKKFDMEAIDTGVTGRFVMELVIREKDDEADMLGQVYQALAGIDSRGIRLGNKKTRGYGEMELLAVRMKEYTKENILEYKDAYDIERVYEELCDCKEKCLEKTEALERYINIEVPLKLTGGICIRKYSSKKGEPDMVHITANGEPVIPGTSFAGAMRSRMKGILKDLFKEYKTEEIEAVMDEIWGYAHKDNSRKSNVTIAESVIEGAVPVRAVRTGVSRFESSAKDRGLREERIYTKGHLKLNVHLLNTGKTEWIVALLLLVIKELQNGYLSIGGQTAVGRGVFAPDGEVLMNGKSVDEKEYFEKFLTKMEEGMAC